MGTESALLETVKAARSLIEIPDVLVVGSQVPNLMQPTGSDLLVVSRDLDLAVTRQAIPDVKACLPTLTHFAPSSSEPAVLLPKSGNLLEVNLLGLDRDCERSYIREDPDLPLVFFGSLSLLKTGPRLVIAGVTVQLPECASLLLEKLATERSGRKGDRDLLVAAGLLGLMRQPEIDRFELLATCADEELRYHIVSNLAILSMLPDVEGMPSAAARRQEISDLVRRLGGKA